MFRGYRGTHYGNRIKIIKTVQNSCFNSVQWNSSVLCLLLVKTSSVKNKQVLILKDKLI